MPLETNRHHILHHNRFWCADRNNKRLRQSMGLIAALDGEVHTALHNACPAPPPLDVHVAQQTAHLYQPHPNPLIGIDNFRYAVEQAIRHPRTHDIERQLGMLTIEAVTLQLPFIREGLVADIDEM